MDIFNVPFSWQIGMLIGIVALYVLFKALELPKDYNEKQSARQMLKRKVAEMELEQAQMKNDLSEINKN